MTTPASAIEGLRSHAEQRSRDARAAIEKAIRDLRRQGKRINVNSVAHRAGVNRKTIYNHPDLRERIRAYTQRPRAVLPEPTAGGDS